MIESISAVTLATHDMARAVAFYRILGFKLVPGGENGEFTTFRAGANYLNLIAQPTWALQNARVRAQLEKPPREEIVE